MSTENPNTAAAIVTGAGSGIGEAVARALAAGGVRVVIAGRRGELLQQVADSLAADGGEAIPFVVDLATPDGPGRLVDAALEYSVGSTSL